MPEHTSEFTFGCYKRTFSNQISQMVKMRPGERASLPSFIPLVHTGKLRFIATHGAPLSPCTGCTSYAYPCVLGKFKRNPQSHRRTYLTRSHSIGTPAGKGGSSSRCEPGASRDSSPCGAPAAAACRPAHASCAIHRGRSHLPGALGGQAVNLPRPFVCRGWG
jgi:hypothetical protein